MVDWLLQPGARCLSVALPHGTERTQGQQFGIAGGIELFDAISTCVLGRAKLQAAIKPADRAGKLRLLFGQYRQFQTYCALHGEGVLKKRMIIKVHQGCGRMWRILHGMTRFDQQF